MKKTTTAPGTQLARVTPITEGIEIRGRKGKLEVHGPQSRLLQDEDYEITACDGHQLYRWTAIKRKNGTYKITEVYPGLAKPSTEVRSVKSAADLVLTGTCRNMMDVLEDLNDAVFGDPGDYAADEDVDDADDLN